MGNLSIAMSGGGHRAALFGLGALQYVADAGANADVVSVASVSGGSLTNGYVGQNVDYDQADGTEFEQRVTAPLVRQITTKGTLFAPWTTKAYLALLIVGGLILLVGPWLLLGLPWWARVLAFVGALYVLGVIVGWRGRVCRTALRKTLFSPGGSSTPLSSMHCRVDHVLCSTELRAGDHLYFARDLAYSYQFGCGEPVGVDIASAAAASAALPFAFPPLTVPVGPLGLTGGIRKKPPRRLQLVDGGVYDNMADQWASGYADRLERNILPARYADRAPTELMVVNASAGKEWVDRPGIGVPVYREIVALRADQGIQYDNTTAHRRSALVTEFEQAEASGEGLRGVYVGINQSPYGVAQHYLDDEERGARAADVIELLGDDQGSREAWTKIADDNKKVKTQLSKMTPQVAGQLVYHSYLLAMCNAHVVLGLPLLDLPGPGRFQV